MRASYSTGLSNKQKLGSKEELPLEDYFIRHTEVKTISLKVHDRLFFYPSTMSLRGRFCCSPEAIPSQEVDFLQTLSVVKDRLPSYT